LAANNLLDWVEAEALVAEVEVEAAEAVRVWSLCRFQSHCLLRCPFLRACYSAEDQLLRKDRYRPRRGQAQARVQGLAQAQPSLE
jgi:hypothetical protein